jgi:hypothetical protein
VPRDDGNNHLPLRLRSLHSSENAVNDVLNSVWPSPFSEGFNVSTTLNFRPTGQAVMIDDMKLIRKESLRRTQHNDVVIHPIPPHDNFSHSL